MRNYKTPSNDPIEIGICAGCGHPIYSNENYWLDGDNMIHASGKIAYVKADNKVIGNWTCLFAYMQENAMQDEAASLFGMERKVGA
jgi:hypothetical protein